MNTKIYYQQEIKPLNNQLCTIIITNTPSIQLSCMIACNFIRIKRYKRRFEALIQFIISQGCLNYRYKLFSTDL